MQKKYKLINKLINNLINHQNMYALVTGASSGCGYEYARLLAAKGYNLLIVSNEDAIHDKAQILREDYPIEVRSLVMDLGRQEAAKELYSYCKD